MPPEIIIAHISSLSVFIPLCFYFFIKGKRTKDLNLLLVLLLVSMVCDGLSLLLLQYSINNLPIGNFYFLAQFSILYYLFYTHLSRPRAMQLIYILFVFLCIVNLVFYQGFNHFNTYSNVATGIILIGLALSYFLTLLREMPTVYVYRLPFLWISFATLTYYGGNFFLFLLGDYLSSEFGGLQAIVWILHNFLNIVKNILFAIGIWQTCRSVKLST